MSNKRLIYKTDFARATIFKATINPKLYADAFLSEPTNTPSGLLGLADGMLKINRSDMFWQQVRSEAVRRSNPKAA